MNTKKASYSLLSAIVLFVGLFLIYLEAPFYLGVYFFGIAVFGLLLFCLITLILFAKENIFIQLNTIRLINLLILTGYFITILAMLYIFFIWLIFIVPWN